MRRVFWIFLFVVLSQTLLGQEEARETTTVKIKMSEEDLPQNEADFREMLKSVKTDIWHDQDEPALVQSPLDAFLILIPVFTTAHLHPKWCPEKVTDFLTTLLEMARKPRTAALAQIAHPSPSDQAELERERRQGYFGRAALKFYFLDEMPPSVRNRKVLTTLFDVALAQACDSLYRADLVEIVWIDLQVQLAHILKNGPPSISLLPPDSARLRKFLRTYYLENLPTLNQGAKKERTAAQLQTSWDLSYVLSAPKILEVDMNSFKRPSLDGKTVQTEIKNLFISTPESETGAFIEMKSSQ